MSAYARRLAGLLCLAGALGCGEGPGAGAGASRDASPDTGAVGGLTPEELQHRAEAMSPEQAESLGIVDTTIHLEPNEPMDSTLPWAGSPGGAPAAADTPRPPADTTPRR